MAFLGMRGTGDWATNERPESWREMILLLYPNGSTPLTAMLSMLNSEQTSDPKYHWWTKRLPDQAGDATNVYTDVALSSAYTSGGVEGDVLYVNVSADTASEMRAKHQIMLRKTGDYRHDCRAKVLASHQNGSSSYIAIRLLEDADATYDLDEADYIKVIGSMNPEGGEIPQALGYNPTEFENVTQIFRTALSITRTARRTRLRTADAYQEAKRECLELHAIEMEKSMLWGTYYVGVGENNKPERTTRGLINAIINSNDSTVSGFDLETAAAYAGKTWLQAGEEWLNDKLEEIFRYGSREKMGLIGSKALLGIQKLAKLSGHINLSVGEMAYGIRVAEWITPFGTLYLKNAPLFSHDPTNRNDLLVFEPSLLATRYVDDTFFVSDPEDQRNRNNSRDSTEEEYITEIGLEYHHLEAMGFLTGLGQDNNN